MADSSELDQTFGAGMTEGYRQMQDTVRAVIDTLKAGDTEEAILRLEREFWPKWASVNNSMYDLLATNDNQEAAAA